MMGTNGISGYGDNFKKAFSLKMRHSKVKTSFTYCDSVNSLTAFFTSTVASPYAKEANEMLSSTRSRSK